MKNQPLFDVLSDYIAEGKLSRSRTAFLVNLYEQFHENGTVEPALAGHLISSGLGLPSSYYIQCVAYLLDLLRPNKEHRHYRLIETTDYLVSSGVLEQPDAEKYLQAIE